MKTSFSLTDLIYNSKDYDGSDEELFSDEDLDKTYRKMVTPEKVPH
jgi:hypothetical protein